jgi:hypothetical protein
MGRRPRAQARGFKTREPVMSSARHPREGDRSERATLSQPVRAIPRPAVPSKGRRGLIVGLVVDLIAGQVS